MDNQSGQLSLSIVPKILLAIGVLIGIMPLFRAGTLFGSLRVLTAPMATVTGTIEKSEVERFPEKTTTYYSYHIVYRYKVQGRDYTSDTVSHASVFKGQMNIIQPILDKYPVGKRVPVYYDSRAPEFAVLEKEPATGAAIFFGSSVIISLILIGTSLALSRREDRRRTQETIEAPPFYSDSD